MNDALVREGMSTMSDTDTESRVPEGMTLEQAFSLAEMRDNQYIITLCMALKFANMLGYKMALNNVYLDDGTLTDASAVNVTIPNADGTTSEVGFRFQSTHLPAIQSIVPVKRSPLTVVGGTGIHLPGH